MEAINPTQHYHKQGGGNRDVRRDDKTRTPEELSPRMAATCTGALKRGQRALAEAQATRCSVGRAIGRDAPRSARRQ
jgi:hypothetical protein